MLRFVQSWLIFHCWTACASALMPLNENVSVVPYVNALVQSDTLVVGWSMSKIWIMMNSYSFSYCPVHLNIWIVFVQLRLDIGNWRSNERQAHGDVDSMSFIHPDVQIITSPLTCRARYRAAARRWDQQLLWACGGFWILASHQMINQHTWYHFRSWSPIAFKTVRQLSVLCSPRSDTSEEVVRHVPFITFFFFFSLDWMM